MGRSWAGNNRIEVKITDSSDSPNQKARTGIALRGHTEKKGNHPQLLQALGKGNTVI